MEGEFFERRDVVAIGRHPVRPDVAQWDLSLRRLARAQAILWHETPISERMKLLDRVDRELDQADLEHAKGEGR